MCILYIRVCMYICECQLCTLALVPICSTQHHTAIVSSSSSLVVVCSCWHSHRLLQSNKDEWFCHIVKSSEGGRSSRAPLLAPASESLPPTCYDSSSHVLPTQPMGGDVK